MPIMEGLVLKSMLPKFSEYFEVAEIDYDEQGEEKHLTMIRVYFDYNFEALLELMKANMEELVIRSQELDIRTREEEKCEKNE